MVLDSPSRALLIRRGLVEVVPAPVAVVGVVARWGAGRGGVPEQGLIIRGGGGPHLVIVEVATLVLLLLVDCVETAHHLGHGGFHLLVAIIVVASGPVWSKGRTPGVGVGA